MKDAALGVRMHSGWGVLVCISGELSAPKIVDRRRIVVVESSMEAAKQPYHCARTLPLEEAECHLQKCSAVSERLALEAIREVVDTVNGCDYRIVGCAMLLASGHPLPTLPNILASHALVHTAEGEFFRKVVRVACEHCRIHVEGFRERELDQRANAAFGGSAASVRQRISDLRRTIGSPWTRDEKTAALAGLIVCDKTR